MDYICTNCGTRGRLTIHGRCSTCDSDAVALADSGETSCSYVGGRNVTPEVELLEELYRAQ